MRTITLLPIAGSGATGSILAASEVDVIVMVTRSLAMTEAIVAMEPSAGA